MAEGLQAGRLEVPVVADLAGFARELRTQVEAAAEGLVATVSVEINKKGLRKRLKKIVEKASKGVTATVGVHIDEERLQNSLNDIRRRLDATDLTLPVRPGGDGERGDSLAARIRSLVSGAQGEADRTPVNVPVRLRMPGRGNLRMLGIGALVSLAQPAVALLGQYGAGLTALVSAAAPAVGVLGAIPGLITAAGMAAIGTKVAFSGFGEALKESAKAQEELAAEGKISEAQQKKLDQALGNLSKSGRKTVTEVTGLAGAWGKVRKSVGERFFSKVVDDIKPLANATLPLLKKGLGDSAGLMGSLAERGAKAMQTGVFRKDFKTVAASSNRVLGSMAGGVANLAAAAGHFTVAAGPFTERVGRGIERFSLWARASAQAGRETGSLAKFLDHAGDKAAILGRTAQFLGQGLAGVGRAGMDSGNALLNGLEASMLRFSRWANSGEGRKSMEQFFSDAAPTFRELNMLVGDFVRGLGKMAKDNGVRDLISQVRTELMPGVGAFLNALGGSVGPAVIGLISNIASLVATLSSAGVGIGTLLASLNGLLNIVNGLLGVVPGLGTGLGVVLGVLLGFRVLASIIGLMGRLGTSIRGIGTVATTAAAGGAAQTTLWNRMGAAYTTAAASGNRLTGTMRGIGGAAGAMRGSMGGLMGALGGPWGAAIAAVTIGIGLLANRHEKAAAAAREQANRINSLAQALRESSGAIDANVRAQAASLLQDTKLGDGKGKLVDRMREANVTLEQLTRAYLGEDGGLKALQKRLEGTAAANTEVARTGRGASIVHNETGVNALRAADALKGVSGELSKSKQQNKEHADAVRGTGSAGANSYTRLAAAVQAYSDKTQSADARTNALKRALEALSGNSQSVHDATAQLNSVMLAVEGTMKGTIEKSDGWGKSLVANNGLVDTATRNGQTLNSQLGELRDSMLSVATTSMEAAEKNIIPMSEAMSTSEAAMEKTRAKALELAASFNIPAKQAKALVDEMGFVPETITTLVTPKGLTETTAGILALRSNMDKLDAGQKVEIDALTGDALKQVQALGFTVEKVPDSKKVEVSAPTAEAKKNLKTLASEIATTPGKKQVTVEAVVNRAAADLDKVRSRIQAMKGKKLVMEAPTKLAQNELERLGFRIKELRGKKVEITAPTGAPISQVRSLQATIDRLHGKTVTVTTNYVVTGNAARRPGAHGSQLAQANGGIVQYAMGGIHAMAGRVKAFAQGTENHIAQIAKAGTWRVWAEDETGGEAYLPLHPSKRKRSEEILGRVAEMFGGMVLYPGRQNVSSHADGGIKTNRSPRTAERITAPRANTPEASLVGGDLNLNIASVGTVRDAFDDALFELRRFRLGGGG
ncbi:hypothetical protein [Streptomyces anulatus]|uniref:hypothetical protein n=1 Tax=Streptomyces anulatus TaxID=1892 RepID=UPI0036545B83